MHSFVLTCPLGLEALAKKEVQKLGYNITLVRDKAIYFEGPIEAIAHVNIWSRFGNTVYLVLKSDKQVQDFDTYFDSVYVCDWEKYIPNGYEILVQAASIKSDLSSVPTLQSLAKKAIVKKIAGESVLREDPSLGKIQVQILIQENELFVMLNTSGAGLHKRGYREMTGDAPLKENMAAALVILSGWRFKEPFYDIFCGSGTIAIEAAMIARNMAPGTKREYDFEFWDWLPENMIDTAIEQAQKKEFTGEYKIYCSDIRKDVIELAKRNAKFAGVGEDIKFTAQDYTTYMRREIQGTLVSNPPYGLRLEADAEKIHRDIAQLFEENTSLGGGIITSHSEFESYSKCKYKRRKLYNGGEQVYFYKKEAA